MTRKGTTSLCDSCKSMGFCRDKFSNSHIKCRVVHLPLLLWTMATFTTLYLCLWYLKQTTALLYPLSHGMMVLYIYNYCAPPTTSELVPIEMPVDPLYLFMEALLSNNYGGIVCTHCWQQKVKTHPYPRSFKLTIKSIRTCASGPFHQLSP